MTQGTPAVDVDRLLTSAKVTAWGIARNDPALPAAPALPTAISLLACFDPAEFEGMEAAPTEAYYRGYCRVNALLNAAVAELAGALLAAGYVAEAIPATVPEEQYDTIEDWCQVPVFPHKTAATQAGLGWIGKTALFLSPDYGPRVRLATVFTDLVLPPGEPVTASRCGSCRRCIDACPAGAGRDVLWMAGLPREALYDCRACELETWKYEDLGGVCGLCIVACPWGRD